MGLQKVLQELKDKVDHHGHPQPQDTPQRPIPRPAHEPEGLGHLTQQAIDTFLYSKSDNGEIKGIGYWQCANGYTAILQHDLWSGSTRNTSTIRDLLSRVERHHPNLINEFNDDTLWWGLCLFSLYEVTKEPAHLLKAAKIWTHASHSVVRRGQYKVKGMDMEGGVFWTTRPDEEALNSITTGLYAEFSAVLATLPASIYPSRHLPPPQTLIQAAKTSLNWILRCRYRAHDAIVTDTIRVRAHELVDWAFTYTTGQAIAACAALFAATDDSSYLAAAEPMVRHSVVRQGWVDRDGILVEYGAYGPGKHKPWENNDAVGFKSVLVRGLAKLYRVLRERDLQPELQETIRRLIGTTFQSLCKRNTSPQGNQYGPWWSGPMELPTSHSQLAVLDVMSAIRLVGVPSS